MRKFFFSLGLMSGTSGDGVDASIIQSDGDTEYKVILDKYFKYSQNIYENIHNLKEKINNSFIKASKSKLKNILAISNEPLVSSDFNHNPNSAIVDAALTKVIDNKMAKVSAWYDNEWGFACRMCDLANYLGKI